MKLGSLFDGIGGFPLAAVRNGITPVWASEIEPFPMQVTGIRFPDMAHVGDITKLHGANLPVVDVVTGGSPCQDLSVAGNREGLDGERSKLFLEQVRIIKEMRRQDGRRGKTDGKNRAGGNGGATGRNGIRAAHLPRPRYMVWENVPGAFSSGRERGADFHRVLAEVCRIREGTLSLPRPPGGAWAPAGLIMGEGFSVAWRVLDAQFWGVPQRRRRIFLVADFNGHSAGEILFESQSVWRNYQAVQKKGQGAPKDAGRGPAVPGRNVEAVCLMDQGGERMDVYHAMTGTLLAEGHSNPPIVMATAQGGAEIGTGICPTLTAAAGLSGNNQPVLFDNHGKDCRYTGPVEIAQTITSALGTGGNNAPLAIGAPDEPYCIMGNIINRKDRNGGNGKGYQQGISYTLTTEDRHCIVENSRPAGKAGRGKKLVRKLVPLECERLMGYPDGWTDIPGASDSKKYRALGNSVAVPCVDFILSGIAYFLSRNEEEEENVPIP